MLSCDRLFQEITDKSVRDLNMNKMQLMFNWQKNGAEPTLNAMKQLSIDERADVTDYISDLPLYEQISVGEKVAMKNSLTTKKSRSTACSVT